MKNPLTYLKHIVKDPINTIAEADARKKEIMPLLFISLAVMLVPAIIMAFVDLSFLTFVALIGFLGVALCVFLLFVISKAKAKFAALTCDDCGTMIAITTREEFDQFVSYEVLQENTNAKISHPSSNNGVVSFVRAHGDATASLQVSFKCPNCGKVKTFRYTITPFKCEREQKNVRVADVEIVKANLESAINAIMEKYNSDDRKKIPYSIQSIHHPDYENRGKPQMVKDRPAINGVTIVYHREIDEMIEGLFIRNELNGSISVEKK